MRLGRSGLLLTYNSLKTTPVLAQRWAVCRAAFYCCTEAEEEEEEEEEEVVRDL